MGGDEERGKERCNCQVLSFIASQCTPNHWNSCYYLVTIDEYEDQLKQLYSHLKKSAIKRRERYVVSENCVTPAFNTQAATPTPLPSDNGINLIQNAQVKKPVLLPYQVALQAAKTITHTVITTGHHPALYSNVCEAVLAEEAFSSLPAAIVLFGREPLIRIRSVPLTVATLMREELRLVPFPIMSLRYC